MSRTERTAADRVSATLSGLAALVIAAGAGIAAFTLVNALPGLVWGEGILLVSLFFTLLPAAAVGALTFAFTLQRCGRWMTHVDGRPHVRRWLAGFILVAALASLLAFWYPREIERSWSEQVLNVDGTTFVAHRRQWHAKKGFRESALSLFSIRDSQISFPDLDGSDVTVRTELFPDFVGVVEGRLYLILGPRPSHYQGRMVAQIETATWGKSFNLSAQRAAVRSGKQWVPLTWDQVPEAITRRNLLVCDPADLPRESAGPLSLDEKEERWRTYVRDRDPQAMAITHSVVH